jgi:hypothetical protein
MTASPHGLPLGLQYVFTNLACGMFAAAMIDHPSARGGTVVDIVTRDAARLTPGETETVIHAAILLPSGDLLDAEGLRTMTEICQDFGLRHALTITRPAPERPSTPEHVLIRHVADLCGWSLQAPHASDIKTATSAWKAAGDHFDALGGMNGTPATMIEKCIGALKRSANRRTRRRLLKSAF